MKGENKMKEMITYPPFFIDSHEALIWLHSHRNNALIDMVVALAIAYTIPLKRGVGLAIGEIFLSNVIFFREETIRNNFLKEKDPQNTISSNPLLLILRTAPFN